VPRSIPKLSKRPAVGPHLLLERGHPTFPVWRLRLWRRNRSFDCVWVSVESSPVQFFGDRRGRRFWWGFHLLVLDLDEYQPRIVPAAVALWIIAHPPLRIIQCVSAEWVVSGQVAELVQHLVRGHVVSPGGSHRALKCYLVFLGRISSDSLDAAEFR
jgi:hypothetical protein